MYLPVTPVRNKRRKGLNLLEVSPHSQHGPHVKQHKVFTAEPCFSCDFSIALKCICLTLTSLTSLTVLLTCTCLETPRATQILQHWWGSWKSVRPCKTRLIYSTSFTWWSTDIEAATHTYLIVSSGTLISKQCLCLFVFCNDTSCVVFRWPEGLIGWWSCQFLGRAESACVPCWRSCMYKLEPAKSGDSSDTSLGYYARKWRSSLRSVTSHLGPK